MRVNTRWTKKSADEMSYNNDFDPTKRAVDVAKEPIAKAQAKKQGVGQDASSEWNDGN